MAEKQWAISTGKAASYCFVTAETIVNWIKKGLLPAQKTAGGQYRILVASLRTFMLKRGMTIEQLDRDFATRPMCWEYRKQARGGNRVSVPVLPQNIDCTTCPIHRNYTLNCWTQVHEREVNGHTVPDCRHCAYFKQWAKVDSEN